MTSGPPDFVPDSTHVRTIRDELEQMVDGLTLRPQDLENRQAFMNRVMQILRSAVETVRLMNAFELSEQRYGQAFHPMRVSHQNVLSMHAHFWDRLKGLTSDDPNEVERAQAVLERIGDELRDYLKTWDHSAPNRRKMPALMRGSDAGDLALTRRQQSYIRTAATLDRPDRNP